MNEEFNGKKMTLTVALKNFFGYRPHEGLKEFQQELKALTDQDKEDFKAMFASIGCEIIPAK